MENHNFKLLNICIAFSVGIAGDRVWCKSDYNRRCICSWREKCHYHESSDKNGLDVPVELSDEIQLPQIRENLPQSHSQMCSRIW